MGKYLSKKIRYFILIYQKIATNKKVNQQYPAMRNFHLLKLNYKCGIIRLFF